MHWGMGQVLFFIFIRRCGYRLDIGQEVANIDFHFTKSSFGLSQTVHDRLIAHDQHQLRRFKGQSVGSTLDLAHANFCIDFHFRNGIQLTALIIQLPCFLGFLKCVLQLETLLIVKAMFALPCFGSHSAPNPTPDLLDHARKMGLLPQLILPDVGIAVPMIKRHDVGKEFHATLG